MIDRHTVFEIHRLRQEGMSKQRIATTLHLDRKTVRRVLRDPDHKRPPIEKASKLDPFKQEIQRLLDIDPKASAPVILQRIAAQGFDGSTTIVKDYLRQVRACFKKKQAFIRFESLPGEQIQVDWGHFGSLAYGGTKRRLYCLALLECHSRLLYLEFTHSQRQETLHRCLLNAFRFFNGTPKEIVTDNMLTAVTERIGPLIRFNSAFLDFLRPFAIVPRACNPNSPQERVRWKKG